jgi:hypothetical protein
LLLVCFDLVGWVVVIRALIWLSKHLVLAGRLLAEVVITGCILVYDTFIFLTTLHSFFKDSNTVCHPHMANTFVIHLAITCSS